jgi:hypothetical protein
VCFLLGCDTEFGDLEAANEKVKAAYLKVGELADRYAHSIAVEAGMVLINNNKR